MPPGETKSAGVERPVTTIEAIDDQLAPYVQDRPKQLRAIHRILRSPAPEATVSLAKAWAWLFIGFGWDSGGSDPTDGECTPVGESSR